MARLWQCGAELQSATALMEVDTVSGAVAIDTTTKRSGAASFRMNCTGTAKYLQHQYNTGTNSYFSAWFYFASFPGSTAIILRLWDGAGGQLVQITSAGKLQFIDSGGTQRGSDTAALSTGVWYNIQLSALEFGGFAGQEARLNGVQIGTIGTAYTGDFIRIGVQSSVTMDMYVDDIIINDTSGSAQNSWPSLVSRIVHAHPNAAGDSNTFEKQGGGAGSSTNYQDADEITPDDATTYLVRDTGASNQAKDLYNIESSSTVGIGASDTIVCVAVGARVGSTSATNAAGRNLNYGIKAGGTEAWSGSIDASINGWTTNADPVPRNYKYVAYVDPSDAAAWTATKIDSLQIGVRCNSAATTDVRFSAVWVSIEFITPYTGSVTESGTATETDSAVLSLAAAAAESATATETDSAVLSRAGDITEAGTATDSTDASVVSAGGSTYNEGVTEAATASDANTTALEMIAAATEPATAIDVDTAAVVMSAATTETVTASDANIAAVIMIAAATEPATAIDVDTAAVVMSAAATEPVTASDANTAAVEMSAGITETVTASDANIAAIDMIAAATEPAAASDVNTAAIDMSAAATETVTASDANIAAVVMNAGITETGNASDTIIGSDGQDAVVQEITNATDINSTSLITSGELIEAASSEAQQDANVIFINELLEAADANDTVACSIIKSAFINEAAEAIDFYRIPSADEIITRESIITAVLERKSRINAIRDKRSIITVGLQRNSKVSTIVDHGSIITIIRERKSIII